MKETKKIMIDVSERDMLKKAMESSENEKVDFFRSIIGGNSSIDNETAMCDADRAYADCTYVKK